jgi:GR25 family glycosyltransferase involved in LPS biosynthesis
MKKKYLYILFIIIIIIILLLLLNYSFKEGYTNNKYDNFDMYVISLRNEERMKNIKEQQKKIDKEIIIFDGINGCKLDVDKLKSENVISSNYFSNAKNNKTRMGEYGCYLSHLNLLKQINENNIESKYSIIFEDDFIIDSSSFLDDVVNIINIMDNNFDIIFLGNSSSNHGKNYKDNIYYTDNNSALFGTYCYLVNNNSIEKILKYINIVDMPIDAKYEKLNKAKKIDIFVIYPTIVNHSYDTISLIRD